MAGIINHHLDAIETSKSVYLIEKSYPNEFGWIFKSITLLKPTDKQMPQPNNDGTSCKSYTVPRKSFIVLVDKHTGNVYEVVVNLSEDKVECFDGISTRLAPTDDESKLSNNNNISKAMPSELFKSNLNLLPGSSTCTRENEIRSEIRFRYITKSNPNNFLRHTL